MGEALSRRGIVMKPRRLWSSRLILIAGQAAALAGMAREFSFFLEARDGTGKVMLLLYLLGYVTMLVLTLAFNGLGVSGKGLILPWKPLRKLSHEPWVVPWQDISAIVLIPREEYAKARIAGRPWDDFYATKLIPPLELPRRDGSVRPPRLVIWIVSKRREWLLVSEEAMRWLGRVDGVRFLAALRLFGEEIRKKGGPLVAAEAEDLLAHV